MIIRAVLSVLIYMVLTMGLPAGAEECSVFNPPQVTVAGAAPWRVILGGAELQFSRSPHEAQQALRVIQYYGMNKRCVIGDPRRPSMEYYLVDNQAPPPSKVLMRGEDCIGFGLPNTEVQQIGGRWKIVEGT